MRLAFPWINIRGFLGVFWENLQKISPRNLSYSSIREIFVEVFS